MATDASTGRYDGRRVFRSAGHGSNTWSPWNFGPLDLAVLPMRCFVLATAGGAGPPFVQLAGAVYSARWGRSRTTMHGLNLEQI